jgi:uncharacterized membrane protein YqgA involved in biofilm formation
MAILSLSQRFKIALGGFVSFIGCMILILAFLSVTKAASLEGILQNELIISFLAIVGILDVSCGFLLLRKK